MRLTDPAEQRFVFFPSCDRRSKQQSRWKPLGMLVYAAFSSSLHLTHLGSLSWASASWNSHDGIWVSRKGDSDVQLERMEQMDAEARCSPRWMMDPSLLLLRLSSAAVEQWDHWRETEPGTWKLFSLAAAWETQRRSETHKNQSARIKAGQGTFSSPKASASFPLSSVSPENRTPGSAPIVPRISRFRTTAAELQPAAAGWCQLFCPPEPEPGPVGSSQLQVCLFK